MNDEWPTCLYCGAHLYWADQIPGSAPLERHSGKRHACVRLLQAERHAEARRIVGNAGLGRNHDPSC